MLDFVLEYIQVIEAVRLTHHPQGSLSVHGVGFGVTASLLARYSSNLWLNFCLSFYTRTADR